MNKKGSDFIPREGEFTFGKNKGYIKLPEDYDPLKQYKLILFFHGRGGSARDNNFTKNDFSHFREKAAAGNFIVAVPEYGSNSWFNESAEKIALEMLDFLYEKLSLYPEYYVMGCSMGGGSALVFVAKHGERVRAVCDIFGVTDYVRFYEEGHYQKSISESYGGTPSEKVQFYRDRSAVNHIDALKNVPVFVIHGDNDTTVPEWNSSVFVEKLKYAGGDVEYVIVSGMGHSNSIIKNLEDKVISFFEKH